MLKEKIKLKNEKNPTNIPAKTFIYTETIIAPAPNAENNNP